MSVVPSVEDVLAAYMRPYQQRFVSDRARRIFVLKSRRIGFSQAAIIKAVLIAARDGIDVYFCSTSLTNAKELIHRATKFLKVLKRDAGYDLDCTFQKETITFGETGARIMAMPAEKVRGREGTIILDEFSYYQRDRDVWNAIAPAADTDPSLQIIIIGTPFGASGMYYEIFDDQEQGIHAHGEWSVYNIDVYQAHAEGFPVDPEELKRKYPRDTFLQEFCCKFLDDIDQYFEYDLLRSSQIPAPTDEKPVVLPVDFSRFAGIDLASKQDASAVADVLREDFDDWARYWVPRVRVLKEAGVTMDYSPQFETVEEWLTYDEYDGVCVDATGEGASFGQNLTRRFGRKVVEQIKGKQWDGVYADIPEMRVDMERGRLLLAREPRVLNAFSKIKRTATTKGPKFEAKRDADGHADEFSATLLGYHLARSRRKKAGGAGATTVGSLGPSVGKISSNW